MMMIVDTNRAQKPFGNLADDLEALGTDIGVQVKMQQEDIFNSMHRI
jgi:ACT domain-containing protein